MFGCVVRASSLRIGLAAAAFGNNPVGTESDAVIGPGPGRWFRHMRSSSERAAHSHVQVMFPRGRRICLYTLRSLSMNIQL